MYECAVVRANDVLLVLEVPVVAVSLLRNVEASAFFAVIPINETEIERQRNNASIRVITLRNIPPSIHGCGSHWKGRILDSVVVARGNPSLSNSLCCC